ncbi:MAG: hypothetical protein AB1568_04755 [Thermodesulfobacteriota bacterium]
MAYGAGYRARGAWVKEENTSAYGTSAGPTAVDGRLGFDTLLPLISEELTAAAELAPDNTVQAGGGVKGHDLTGWDVGGRLLLRGVYRGLEPVLAAALGYSGYNDPPFVAPFVWRHTFRPSTNLHAEPWTAADGVGWWAGEKIVRRGTLWLDRGPSLWKFVSCMAKSLEIRGDAQGLTVELDLVAHSAQRTFSGLFDVLSIPGGDWRKVMFRDLTVQLFRTPANGEVLTPLAVGVRSSRSGSTTTCPPARKKAAVSPSPSLGGLVGGGLMCNWCCPATTPTPTS